MLVFGGIEFGCRWALIVWLMTISCHNRFIQGLDQRFSPYLLDPGPFRTNWFRFQIGCLGPNLFLWAIISIPASLLLFSLHQLWFVQFLSAILHLHFHFQRNYWWYRWIDILQIWVNHHCLVLYIRLLLSCDC